MLPSDLDRDSDEVDFTRKHITPSMLIAEEGLSAGAKHFDDDTLALGGDCSGIDYACHDAVAVSAAA